MVESQLTEAEAAAILADASKETQPAFQTKACLLVGSHGLIPDPI